jgi:hypothetical protein
MFDVHSLESSPREHFPFGGHGRPGPTIDTFRGAGMDIARSTARASYIIDQKSSAIVQRRMRFAFYGLITGLGLLFITIGVAFAA